jgi:hypothetical protein
VFGTTLFCAELSRRDDLESLSYMLAYLLRGTLPWQELPTNVKDVEGRLKIITQRKVNTAAESLFKGQASE